MTEEDVKRLSALLDERTIRLMERESELADRIEEIESQKEELTAAIEELVSKNRELVQSNSELDQLLYRASHDLKTPVASLEGILSLLNYEPLPEQIHPYILHIKSLNAQMNRVLASLSRMRRALLDLMVSTKTDLHKITDKVTHDLSNLPKFSSVQIRTSFAGATEIISEPDLVSILLIELISNAINFRNKQDGAVKIKWRMDEGQMQLTVEDDGEGIDLAVGDKIFDMFYRGSSNSIGSGMGLYIVKRLLNRLGGNIKWSSQPGLTIFTASFPIGLT